MGSLVGGLIQSRSASKAAKAQERAANAQIAYQTETRDMLREDIAPFVDSGTNALLAYQYNMGLLDEAPVFGGNPLDVVEFTEDYTETNPAYNSLFPYMNAGRGGDPVAPTLNRSRTRYRVGDEIFDTREAADEFAQANRTGGTEYGGFQASPGYQFRLGQGLDAIEGSAAARGGLYSGATMKALNKFGQDYGSAEFGNYQNQLLGLAGMGQSAAAMQGNNEINFANMYGQAQANIGNAQAAGAIGQGNAWANAFNGMAGQYGYQKANNGGGNMLGNLLFGGL